MTCAYSAWGGREKVVSEGWEGGRLVILDGGVVYLGLLL